MQGSLFEACSAEHQRTKVAKRPLWENDPSRSDRDRRPRGLLKLNCCLCVQNESRGLLSDVNKGKQVCGIRISQ